MPELKEKLLKVRPKEYIHLNLVSDTDEEMDSDTKCECLLLQLHGDVVSIKNKRRPINMEDIGRSEGQSTAQRILVEGCPGIGKTMFSWELCRQWAEGTMLQDRDIVVMLQLRSKRVREANRLSDLFHHSNDRVKHEVEDYITSVEGKGVFLVLEGFDELVEDQKMEGSIIYELLTGDCLPYATVMVTSRPVASGSLCIDFIEHVDQHIEVVGFNDEDIKSYVERACQKEPQILPDLISYVSSNPFVYSVMYIPLQCAIITALYIEKWKKAKGHIYAPTTLTQLYTDVLLSSLIRYIGDQPVYSKLKGTISKLSDLPSEVQEKVWQLSQLAAEGLENKRFIFDSIPCDHMGLMQSTEEEMMIGSSSSYCFLHLTLQEYLAALHWSRMESKDILELVSKTNLFPLNTLARDGIDKKPVHYHWPALYFLSGLTKLTFMPMHLLKSCLSAAYGEVSTNFAPQPCRPAQNLSYFNIAFKRGTLEFFKPVVNDNAGSKCSPYFFQLLFETLSHDLVNRIFAGELVRPVITNPLDCFITCWCVANSSTTSQWTLDIKDELLETFIRYAEKLGCSSVEHQCGPIIGLKIDPSVKYLKEPPKTLALLPSLIPRVEYLLIVSAMDMAPLLSNLHLLVALNFIAFYCNVTEGIKTLQPQQCPSLSTVIIYNLNFASYMIPSVIFPSISTVVSLRIPTISGSNLDILCSTLCKNTCRLRELKLMDLELSTEDAHWLAQALEMNRSLKKFFITGMGLKISTDGHVLLRQALRNHPTIEDYELPFNHYADQILPQSPENTVTTEGKDLELALALSLSESKQNSEELEKNELAHAIISEDEDLELALALSLSEIKQKSEEEKEELPSDSNEDLQYSKRPSVAEDEQSLLQTDNGTTNQIENLEESSAKPADRASQ